MADIIENEEPKFEELQDEALGDDGQGGDPIETGPEVIVVDEDGEIDGVAPQYCKGSFRMLTSDGFTQNADYSDDYLKSKGLFKMDGEITEA